MMYVTSPVSACPSASSCVALADVVKGKCVYRIKHPKKKKAKSRGMTQWVRERMNGWMDDCHTGWELEGIKTGGGGSKLRQGNRYLDNDRINTSARSHQVAVIKPPAAFTIGIWQAAIKT